VLKELDRLLDEKDKNILFVGIGNVLKSDDGAGVYISNRINNRSNVTTLTVETGIENYIGKINSIKPDILILIDCVDIKLSPGNAMLLDINQITDITFNTHNISLKKIAEFFPMDVYILAIQPVSVLFGENISYIVKDISDKIINLINREEA